MLKIILKGFTPLFFLFLISSCKKGDVGPQGPQGPQGTQGETGSKGEAGSANVKYSAWFTPSSYVRTTVYGLSNFTYAAAATEVTQDIIDQGTVLVYGKLNGYNDNIWPTNSVGQLPITLSYIITETSVDTWDAILSPAKITIRMVNSTNTYTTLNHAHQFRYIVIPGGSAISGRVSRDYQSMSYSEVCSLLQIPE